MDDTYITNFAKVLKYGSDGVNPYNSTQSNPVYPPLNSNLKIYVEFSNELWNGAPDFTQTPHNLDSAVAEVNAGGSPLNFDGDNNQFNWSWRRIAKKGLETSLIFRSVFGNGDMMTRVRPVLMSQQGGGEGPTFEQFRLLMDYYNNPAYVSTPHPPSYYFYGSGGSAYYDPENGSDSLTIDNIWNSNMFDVNTWKTTYIDTEVDWPIAMGLKRIAYEGGPSMDNVNHSEAVKAQAWGDQRMRTLMNDHQTMWNQNAGNLLMYFTLASDYQWGFVSDVFSTATSPKMQAIADINAATRHPSTRGTSIPGTITASTYKVPMPWWEGSGTNFSGHKWIGYSVNTTTSRSFNVTVNVSSGSSGAQLEVWIDGVISTVSVPSSGNTASINTGTLSAGTHGLMLLCASGSYTVNSITFQ